MLSLPSHGELLQVLGCSGVAVLHTQGLQLFLVTAAPGGGALSIHSQHIWFYQVLDLKLLNELGCGLESSKRRFKWEDVPLPCMGGCAALTRAAVKQDQLC